MQTLEKSKEKTLSLQEQNELWPDFRRMREMMESFWQRPWSLPALPGQALSVNMFRDGSNLVVEAHLPGVNKADIKVKIENSSLTIEADHKEEDKRDEKEHFFREIRHQHFFRRIPLPMEVDEENAKATFEGGVLHMKFPILKPDAATPKTISID